MARYIIEELRPAWVREFYEVEAESEQDAEEGYMEGGRYGYLGHTLGDTIDLLGTEVKEIYPLPEGELPENLEHVVDRPKAKEELLEACKAWLSDDYADNEDGYRDKARALGRAAIAKATGGEA